MQQRGTNIIPITIHHYRNLTQTTENTLSMKTNNPISKTQPHKNLKKIINHLHEEPLSHNQAVTIAHKQNSYTPQIDSQTTKKSLSNARYKSKKQIKKPLDYEPVLSKQVHENQKSQSKRSRIGENSSQKDIKEFTFGEKYYENPQISCSHQQQFDLVSQRDQKMVKQEREKRERRNQFWERFQRNRQNENLISESSAITQREPQTTLFRLIQEDKQKNPGAYAAGAQAGLSDKQIYQKKASTLNYELEKFLKSKGDEYLKQIKMKVRSQSTKALHMSKQTQSSQQLPSINSKRALHTEQKQKYPNYIPEVFPRIDSRKKKLKTQQSKGSVISKGKRENKAINKQFEKYSKMNEREEMLGKLVLTKVEDHFKLTKQKGNQYFNRVKSEEEVDEAWVQYLRTKINRADYALSIQ